MKKEYLQPLCGSMSVKTQTLCQTSGDPGGMTPPGGEGSGGMGTAPGRRLTL